MKHNMIPAKGFLVSLALLIALLFDGPVASAGSDNASGGSDTIAAWLFIKEAASSRLWKIDFITPQKNTTAPAGPFVQKGTFNAGTYSLLAEVGEIQVSPPPVPFTSVPRKGGRLSLNTGAFGRSLRLAVFTATNDRHTHLTRTRSESAGVSSEFGFLAERARIGASFATGGETSGAAGGRRGTGNISRIYTLFDPFSGKLVADGEIGFSNVDRDVSDGTGAVRGRTCKLRIGGKTGFGEVPFDWEYRKLLSAASGGTNGVTGTSSDTDAVSGGLRYLKGLLDLWLRAGYSRQTDRTSSVTETSATNLSFSPRFLLGNITLSPSFSLDRRRSHANNLRTDIYSFDLGAKGNIPETKLDYELKGSLKQLESDSSATKHTVATTLKIPAPFLEFLALLVRPSLNIKGEYSSVDRKPTLLGEDGFTLSFSLDSV